MMREPLCLQMPIIFLPISEVEKNNRRLKIVVKPMYI